jgi:hypothetical protein
MPDENPGFDFITLTKAQWAHLKLIERDHGIPWYIYFRDLVKRDMEGKLLYPAVRERRKKLKPDVSTERVEVLLNKVEELLKRPQQMVVQGPQMPAPHSGDFSGVIEADNIKPSDIVDTVVEYNPQKLSDGSNVADIRTSIIDELREKFNLPPLERSRKAPIQFPGHVKVVDAPNPPAAEQ